MCIIFIKNSFFLRWKKTICTCFVVQLIQRLIDLPFQDNQSIIFFLNPKKLKPKPVFRFVPEQPGSVDSNRYSRFFKGHEGKYNIDIIFIEKIQMMLKKFLFFKYL